MKITRRHITKSIAIIYGLLGALWLFIGLVGIMDSIGRKDLTQEVIMFCIIVSGAIGIAIGVQVFIKYSGNALRNLCGLIGFTVFNAVEYALPQVSDVASGIKEICIRSSIIILPFLLGFAAYKISMRLLR